MKIKFISSVCVLAAAMVLGGLVSGCGGGKGAAKKTAVKFVEAMGTADIDTVYSLATPDMKSLIERSLYNHGAKFAVDAIGDANPKKAEILSCDKQTAECRFMTKDGKAVVLGLVKPEGKWLVDGCKI